MRQKFLAGSGLGSQRSANFRLRSQPIDSLDTMPSAPRRHVQTGTQPCTGRSSRHVPTVRTGRERAECPERVQCETGGMWLMQLPVRACVHVFTGLLRRCRHCIEATVPALTFLSRPDCSYQRLRVCTLLQIASIPIVTIIDQGIKPWVLPHGTDLLTRAWDCDYEVVKMPTRAWDGKSGLTNISQKCIDRQLALFSLSLISETLQIRAFGGS